jgi:hypothetical protein
VIRVLGVDVPRAAIAELALRLHRAGKNTLAAFIGSVIDMNHDELVLWRKDYATILVVLDGKPIPGLETLRELLEEANSGVDRST